MLAAGTTGGNQFGDAAGKSAGSRFGSVFKTAAKASLVGIGALAVGAIKVGADSIAQASDLNESLNAVNLSYEGQAKAVKKLGREAAVGLGLSNSEFNSLAVRFSSFSKTIAGSEGPKVTKTLDDLTTRASDFASVMNLDVNEAAQLFQSGLAGETEPLRAYGLDLSAARVEAFALSTGIVKNKDDLTESAKVQARYALLMKETSQTQGDFSNTSDGLANSQRILSARLDNAQAKLGKGLLPIMEDAVAFVNKKGIPAFLDFADFFTEKGIPAIKDFGDDAVKVAKKVKPLIDLFADLPAGGKIAAIGTALAGGLVVKHQVSKIFDRGGIANPMFVVVTNPGGPPDANPKGRLGKVASTVGKYVLPAAAIGLAVNNVGNQLDAAVKRHPNAKPDDFGISNEGYVDFSKPKSELFKSIDELGAFAVALDKVDNKKIRPGVDDREIAIANNRISKFLTMRSEAVRAIKPTVDTSDIERATEKVAHLIDLVTSVTTLGLGGGLGSAVAGANQRAGVNFNGPITVQASDPRQLARELDKKTRDRSRGGR